MQGSVLFSSLQASGTQNNGMALAWVILVGMLVALGFVIFILGRGFQGKSIRTGASWQQWAVLVLALAGMGVAIYLTYIEITSAQAICGPLGDCNAVQKSEYAKVLGIPVGLVGALGYLVILAAWLWRRFRKDNLASYVPPAIFGMATFGTLYSIYLTYLEIFVIKAVCIWCLTSAVIMTLLMLLTLAPAANWLAVSGEEE